MELKFDENVTKKASGIKMGVALIKNVTVIPKDPKTSKLIDEEIERIQTRMKGEDLLQSEEIKSMRDLYRKVGFDPTKTRPSAEALLRMVMNKGTIHKINNIVDTNNVGSLHFLLPIGSYNLANIKGDLYVRFSKANEKYVPMGTKSQRLQEGTIIVSDTEKVLCVGYASSDSEHSKITKNTKDVLLLVYGPPAISSNKLLEATKWVAELMSKESNGAVGEVYTCEG